MRSACEAWVPGLAALGLLALTCALGCAGASSGHSRTEASEPAPSVSAKAQAPRVHLFACAGRAIHAFEVDRDSGALTFLSATEAGERPTFLAFDPERRRILATDERDPGLIRSLRFDAERATLTEQSAQNAGGAGTTHVSFASREWALAANYHGGSVALLPLDAEGALGAATDTQASGPASHWAGVSPSGHHAFVAVLGQDRIAQYRLDRAQGSLTTNGHVALPPGTGPRHLVFHPSGRWAYSINENAVSVTAFSLDERKGALRPTQSLSALASDAGPHGAEITGAEIAIHPNGRHLYASTRGHDSLAQFAIGPDGTLSWVTAVPTGGPSPRSFGLSPDGNLLYVGHQLGDSIVAFRVDPDSGALRALGPKAKLDAPIFVGLAAMAP